MFSCFCDTFCCCLHRFRDSSSRNTPTSFSSSKNKNKDVAEDTARRKEEGTATEDFGRPRGVEDVQPAPRIPMPSLGGAFAESDTSKRESSSHQSEAHSEEPAQRSERLSPRPRVSPLSSIFSKVHTRRRSQDPPPRLPSHPPPTQGTPYTHDSHSVATASASGASTPRGAYQSLSPRTLDEAQTRSPTAVLSTIDDMPSASDFLAASTMPDFVDNDVELEVPPQGQIPELEGEDSTKAWREEPNEDKAPADERRREERGEREQSAGVVGDANQRRG